jgi:hypothetical protein
VTRERMEWQHCGRLVGMRDLDIGVQWRRRERERHQLRSRLRAVSEGTTNFSFHGRPPPCPMPHFSVVATTIPKAFALAFSPANMIPRPVTFEL